MQIDLANTLVHKAYFYLLFFIARKLATPPLLRRGGRGVRFPPLPLRGGVGGEAFPLPWERLWVGFLPSLGRGLGVGLRGGAGDG